jgi:hypothetical protein
MPEQCRPRVARRQPLVLDKYDNQVGRDNDL